MKLIDIDTPFKRIKIIECALDGQKIVRHWHMAQHITGPYYKSEDYLDSSGIVSFDIYFKYNEGIYGLLYTKHLRRSPTYRVKLFEDEIKKLNIETPQGYIKELNGRISKGYFIGQAEIEFIRQFVRDVADQLVAYSNKYHKEKRLAEGVEHMELVAVKEQADQDEQKQIEQTIARQGAILLGWGDNMTPLRLNRIMATLNSFITVDNQLMHRYQFIKKWVKRGWKPYKKESETYWSNSKKNLKHCKPRTEYYIGKDNLCYRVTKVEFDFATYLTNNKKELFEKR